jgi:RNA ligase
MKLNQLLDVDLLNQMVYEGYVRFGTHNMFPELRIYEYTAKAMYDRVWNQVTMKTRGLIVNWDTQEVLARPFDKFFNYGQPEQLDIVRLELNDEVMVYDKMDGSLGIRYIRPDGRSAIATKGSFHSEQADWATRELHKYMSTHLDDDLTWLFEIIYPENRIVVEYDFSGLVLLGARNIEDGDEYFPEDLLEWHGRKTTHFRYHTLREALEAPPRPNAEGFVIYLPEFDVRVKVKQEDYLILHRLVSQVNEQYVYDLLSQGKDVGEIVGALPDEFRDFVQITAVRFVTDFAELRVKILKQHREIYSEGMTKKEYAEKAMCYPHYNFMFKLFDNHEDYSEKVWESLSPARVKNQEKKARKSG